MSTATMERLRSEVLTLSEPERAELAHELIKSLDAPADEGVEAAWDTARSREESPKLILDRPSSWIVRNFEREYRLKLETGSTFCTDTRRSGRGSC